MPTTVLEYLSEYCTTLSRLRALIRSCGVILGRVPQNRNFKRCEKQVLGEPKKKKSWIPVFPVRADGNGLLTDKDVRVDASRMLRFQNVFSDFICSEVERR